MTASGGVARRVPEISAKKQAGQSQENHFFQAVSHSLCRRPLFRDYPLIRRFSLSSFLRFCAGIVKKIKKIVIPL